MIGDTLDGGPGDDTFHTRDGEVDHITCGDGNDTALLDNVDVITDATATNPKGSCETIVRKDVQAKNGKARGTDRSEDQGQTDAQNGERQHPRSF
jgi:hypothetical protein